MIITLETNAHLGSVGYGREFQVYKEVGCVILHNHPHLRLRVMGLTSKHENKLQAQAMRYLSAIADGTESGTPGLRTSL